MKKINVNNCIFIDVHNNKNIIILVRNKTDILSIAHVSKVYGSNYKIRMQVLELLDIFIRQYKPDALVIEQNKLFIDKIDRHPDPLVYRNILLGFSIQNSIEDKYFKTIKYIFSIPRHEWYSTILNTTSKYSFDVYKSHILNQSFTDEMLQVIKENNYYKCICFSECIWFDKLLNIKYQINKGD